MSPLPDRQNDELLAVWLPKLTPDSQVTVDRAEGDVFVDGELVKRFLDDNPNVMENFADTLWTHVSDLQAIRAGWPADAI